MEAASQIQRSFLPKADLEGPLHDKFNLFATMKPAKDIGGDFYDYFVINDRKLGFVVGDVSGKGVAAALFMSVARTVLRTIAFEGEEPGDVLSKVNAILSRDNTEGMFVTIFYAVLDLETGAVFNLRARDTTMRCCSAPTNLRAVTLHGAGDCPVRRGGISNGDAPSCPRRYEMISCSPMALPKPSISMVASSTPTVSRGPFFDGSTPVLSSGSLNLFET